MLVYPSGGGGGISNYDLIADGVYSVSDVARVNTEAELTSAIAGAKNTILVDGDITLTGNHTVTQHLIIRNGAVITTDSNVLEINGPFSHLSEQCFSGTGVTFGAGSVISVFSSWFGTDASALQSAIDAAKTTVKSLYIDKAITIAGTGSQIIEITKPLRIHGNRLTSIITVTDSSTASSVFAINSADTYFYKMRIEGIQVVTSGSGYDGNLFAFNYDSTHYLAYLTISNSTIYNSNDSASGYAIFFNNDSGDLNNNGAFLCTIMDSEIRGGIYGNKMGDSNVITRNKIYGANRGIEMTCLNPSDPSSYSAKLVITENNITSLLGAIKLTDASGVVIERNNIEQTTELDDEFCIDIACTAKTTYPYTYIATIGNNKILATDPTSRTGGIKLSNMYGVIIKHNEIAASSNQSPSEINYSIYLENTDKCVIQHNTIFCSLDVVGIYVDADSNNNNIAPNDYYVWPSGTLTASYSNNGEGTIGVFVPVSFASGYENLSGSFSSAGVVLNDNGTMAIAGVVNPTTEHKSITAGDTIATIPSGYRPTKNKSFLGSYYNDDDYSRATVIFLVEQGTGAIQCWQTLSNVGYLIFDGATLEMNN